MRPILFEIFGVTFPAYYTLLTLGFIASVWVVWRVCERRGIDPDDFLDMSLWLLVAGLIGARILHVFADGYFWDYVHLCTDPLQVDVPSFIHVSCAADADCLAADAGALCDPEAGKCHPARDCFAALKFWQGGLAFYGGLILAVIVALVFMRRRKMNPVRMMDIGAAGVALGIAFARTGCYLSGCCFGKVTQSDWGVRFKGFVTSLRPDGGCPKGYDLINVEGGAQVCGFGRPAFINHAEHGLLELHAKHSLPVHATQLYEAAFCLAIFGWLYFYRRNRQRFAGQMVAEFGVLYGIGRFIVEAFRDDDRGLWMLSLSTSQLIGIPIIAAGAWWLVVGRKRGGPALPPAPEATPPEAPQA